MRQSRCAAAQQLIGARSEGAPQLAEALHRTLYARECQILQASQQLGQQSRS